MGDNYSLKITNRSEQPDLTFALYAVTPISETNGTYPIAWQTRSLKHGESVTFSWTLEFSLVFAARGAMEGAIWEDDGPPVALSDGSPATNSAQLDYIQDDYTLALVTGAHPVVPGEVFLDTTATVPSWSRSKGPSFALAMATADGTPVPAIAGTTGPNLRHAFTLHPAYYLGAGQIEQGVMADLDTVTDGQKVVFAAGSRHAAYILNEDDTWAADTATQA